MPLPLLFDNCAILSPAWFQSLGRAQCLCHTTSRSRSTQNTQVSIARSRSMPLPPYQKTGSSSTNMAVSIARSRSMPLPRIIFVLYFGIDTTFQSLGRAQCLCHFPNSKRNLQKFLFQSLGRAQCLCHFANMLFDANLITSFNRSVALNASATPKAGARKARTSCFNRSVALNASATFK